MGRIEATSNGRPLAPEALFDALAAAPVVLLGEKHDNADHHLLQARAIDALVARGRRPALVLEMIDQSQQASLDAARARAPGDVDGLADALRWEQSGWPAWSLYRPLFESAVRHGLPIAAGSLERARVMEVARTGLSALDESFVAAHGLAQPSPDASVEVLRAEMREAHCSLLPEAMMDAMVLVQRVRDATLAAQVKAAFERADSVVLIAGNGHVRTDRGVPRYLARAYQLESRALALLEAQPGRAQVANYAEDAPQPPYDYVWFTPRASDEDPCAALRGAAR